ncbi:hypothetical protein AB0P15_11655 [Streptomyces sp. NPDC087917]|uniref:hypothetical protein n=1 Tax=unclassified Streptomyces TaxID=2593676 RepID=UPI0034188D3D
MLKRYVIALSVTASVLLLPAAGAAQAADDTTAAPAATTATATAGGQTTTTAQTPRQIRTPNGAVVTVGTTSSTHRVSDPTDSSWGG